MIIAALLVVFVVAVFAIVTWKEVRNYQTDKHYDSVIAGIASQENMMRPSGELTKSVTEGIKKQYGGNSNY